MHAGVVAGDQAHSTTRFNGKDVPQFAPNFSVYVLPPDAVCFYSEDRKFFLHGELFCIVADAIAAGKSFGQIVRELTKKFPADVVDQAIKRLIDRRYIVPKRKTAVDAAAGYWATLGIPLEMAAKNLQKCKVRVQSIDAKGAKQLGAALRKLGVRVVDRSADLTVVLVNDYLEGQLEPLNRQHLSDRTPWLLVQPSGVFPLVGPVFSPGKGPCWTCLAERMKRNREVRAMLDRRQARRVAVSPLARDSLGGSGIELAAVEIAKAIASDFRTPLNDHLVSLDLSGPTIVKHYVPRRPQCPSCGPKKLRDPRREPAPLVLTAGAKPVMTSGGYRSVSSRATVAKYRKHVSPLTGVVSKLERVEVDLPLNTNYYASHNFSGPAKSIHELRSGRSGGGSFGKGSTAEQGEASALMEAIERYSGIFQGDEIRVARRFSRLRARRGHLAERRPAVQRRAVPARADRTERRGRDADTAAVRSRGQDRMDAGVVAARPALQISADRDAVFFPQRRIRQPYARGLQRLRRRQYAGGGDRPGIPRAGGAGFLCHLVVQPLAADGTGPRTGSTILTSAI